MNSNADFTVRSAKRTLILMIITACASVAGAVAVLIGNRSEKGLMAALPIFILCGIIFALSCFGLFAYAREKITYCGGILTHTGIFGRSSVEFSQIKWIFTRPGTGFGKIDVMLIDGDNNVKIKFGDSFDIVLNKQFMGLLKENGVKPMNEQDYYLKVRRKKN